MDALATWGKEVMSLAILLPMVWFMLREQGKRNSEIAVAMTNGFERIITSFKEHETKEIENLERVTAAIEELRLRIGRTILTPEQASRILKVDMWYVTKKKLEFLSGILEKNHIAGREGYILEKITTALDTFSQEYVSNFATFDTSCGSLAEWLEKNFTEAEFKAFCLEIHTVVVRPDTGTDKDHIRRMKLGEIETIMEQLQNRLAAKILRDCKY